MNKNSNILSEQEKIELANAIIAIDAHFANPNFEKIQAENRNHVNDTAEFIAEKQTELQTEIIKNILRYGR